MPVHSCVVDANADSELSDLLMAQNEKIAIDFFYNNEYNRSHFFYGLSIFVEVNSDYSYPIEPNLEPLLIKLIINN